MTFSIVAFDPKTKDLGVGVESRFVAVGSVVPWAQSGVGAIAVQSYANPSWGPKGLGLLRRGIHPKEALKRLTAADREAAQRQVGIVDARGRSAAFTGKECFAWAGHVVGRNYAVQGNILTGEDVVGTMARAFESTEGDLPLRLLASLVAGQKAGGDRRGQQSAALLVVREDGGYSGFNDRWIDVRIDDHPTPIEELVRVFNVYDATLLNREDPTDVVGMGPEVVKEHQSGLASLGFYKGPVHGRADAKTKRAFEDWAGMNNFETKLRKDGRIWGSVYRVFRDQVARHPD